MSIPEGYYPEPADFHTDEWQTLLKISEMGIPLYSAGGIQQTLRPIAASTQLARDAQGDLDDVSDANFRKYETTIQCTDYAVPAFDGFWPGMIVTIDCVCELAYMTSTNSPSRTPVEDSQYTVGDFTVYRPQLVCRIVEYEIQTDEWGGETGWTLRAEEI